MRSTNNPYSEARREVREVLGYWTAWLTVDQFARVSGYLPELVEGWCVSGKLPHEKNQDGDFLINYRHLVGVWGA